MILTILFIIAAWLLPLPVAIKVLITIFGSISALLSLIRFIVRCCSAADDTYRHTKTGNPMLDRFL